MALNNGGIVPGHFEESLDIAEILTVSLLGRRLGTIRSHSGHINLDVRFIGDGIGVSVYDPSKGKYVIPYYVSLAKQKPRLVTGANQTG